MPTRTFLCFLVLLAATGLTAAACSTPAGGEPPPDTDSSTVDVADATIDNVSVDVQPDITHPDDLADEPDDTQEPDTSDGTFDKDEIGEDTNLCQCFADSDCDLLEPSGPCLTYTCNDQCTCQEIARVQGESCTPADPCFLTGTCTDGQCLGTEEVDCDDDNPCTLDECIPEVGCNNPPDQGECDDENPCTENDHCEEGECQGDEKICDDENPCTDDICDPLAGCIFTENTSACDDGNPCTDADACFSGQCAPGIDLCECQTDLDCNWLLEEDHCFASAQCDTQEVPYTCKAYDPIQCPDSPTVCQKMVCDPETGECGANPDNDGDECFEPENCVDEGLCENGTCIGEPSVCNDASPCTLDSCVTGQGCVYEPIIQPCNDGDPCTINDFCTDQGLCAGQDVGCGEVPSRGFKLDSLVFAEPGFCLPSGNGDCFDATPLVNSFVQDDINAADNPLVMLGVFDPFDLYGESSEFFLGPGECSAGQLPSCDFTGNPASMNPVDYLDSGTCALESGLQSPAPCFSVKGGQLVVGIMSIVIPLVDTSVSGTFAGMPEPDAIQTGHIKAFLKKTVADTIKVTFPLMPTYYLSELLPADKMDSYDGQNGWGFTMHFSATLIDLQ